MIRGTCDRHHLLGRIVDGIFVHDDGNVCDGLTVKPLTAPPAPGSVEYLREALDYIDAHDPSDASLVAAGALAGTWASPECCNGHGFERRRARWEEEHDVQRP